jgi:hypothetical protein
MNGTLTAPPPPETIARVRPGAPEHISPTAAKSYLTCSLRFYFERVLQLPKPTSPALHLGKAMASMRAGASGLFKDLCLSPTGC